MRQTDDQPHPAAVKRKAEARERSFASLLIMGAALIFVFVKDQPTLGFVVALLSAGIISVDNVKAWLGK